METGILENSDNLPWHLSEPNSKEDILDSIISCPGCNKTQGSLRSVYERKGSTISPDGIGKSSCSFCGFEYKIFDSK